MNTMRKTIALRREDKNEWEKRVPLIPADVKELREKYNVNVIVQPSQIRIFGDEEYRNAGAELSESLKNGEVIFAVKEIPVGLLEAGKTYVFFSHTIKGQHYNMGMLKRLMELQCTLIDYEKMEDAESRRLITFSPHAGMAGTIDTLVAYARKRLLQGVSNPFQDLKQPYQYGSIIEAEDALRSIAAEIRKNGIPADLHPLTIGVAGYGNVAQGVNHMLDLLPVKDLHPSQLASEDISALDNRSIYRIVFKEEDLVKRREGQFDLQEYYLHPENYESIFHTYLPQPQILLNCVYWTESYPRFLTRQRMQDDHQLFGARGLQVIGDISCDIEGAIEITKSATKPDNACYTYDPRHDSFEDGIGKEGITVMAIDNLPCEFPREASTAFSSALKDYVSSIAEADYNSEFETLALPQAVKDAVILHKGRLTPDYRYLEKYL